MSGSDRKTITTKSKEQAQGVATPPAFLWCLLFGMGIFLFATVFFAHVHPLVPYDMDDWLYVGWRRNAYPIWKDWNPARVFPETFMSLVSDFGVHVLIPILHLDYIHALILAHAVSVAFFITVYVMLFRSFIREKAKISSAAAYMLTLLFLLFHFSIFRRQYNGNQHLFWTFNVTGYYYYVIPNLINASLVLFFMTKGKDGIRNLSPIKKGVLFLSIYLAMFSNLFASIILVVPAAGELVLDAYLCLVKRKQSLKLYLERSFWNLLIVGLWLVSLVFEANGGRADGAGGFALSESISGFFAWGGQLNLQTTALSLLIVVVGVVFSILPMVAKGKGSGSVKKQQSAEKGDTAKVHPASADGKSRWISGDVPVSAPGFVFCMLVCVVFEILLCAKVGADKLEICRVIFSVCFYAFLVIFWFAGQILAKWPKTLILLPLIFYVLLMNTRMGERIFLEENGINLDAQLCIAIDQDIIDQIIAADSAGLTEAVIVVPLEEDQDEDNWPHVIRMGSALSQTLYKHGIISRRLELEVQPDHAMNEKYGLQY
ncbi:MAG: hypothetical protein IKH46_07315 [Lachnospiraceae bacterium]|nr:hypothetical protein [Lachnospiraceae bacterium]